MGAILNYRCLVICGIEVPSSTDVPMLRYLVNCDNSRVRCVLKVTHVSKGLERSRYGGFQKWGYPWIIHSNGMFHYKPTILGYPHDYGNPHILVPQIDLQVIWLEDKVSHAGWRSHLGSVGYEPPITSGKQSNHLVGGWINWKQYDLPKNRVHRYFPFFS